MQTLSLFVSRGYEKHGSLDHRLCINMMLSVIDDMEST